MLSVPIAFLKEIVFQISIVYIRFEIPLTEFSLEDVNDSQHLRVDREAEREYKSFKIWIGTWVVFRSFLCINSIIANEPQQWLVFTRSWVSVKNAIEILIITITAVYASISFTDWNSVAVNAPFNFGKDRSLEKRDLVNTDDARSNKRMRMFGKKGVIYMASCTGALSWCGAY